MNEIKTKPVILNLTGHAIRIIDFKHNFVKTYYPEEEECRLETQYHDEIDTLDGVALPELNILGLPEEKEGTYYVVSGYIKAAAPDRKDLLQPDSTRVIRDNNGSYIGVRGFIK